MNTLTRIPVWLLALLIGIASCTSHDESIPSSPTGGVEGAVLRVTLPSSASTRATSKVDDAPTRCYVQVFDGDGKPYTATDHPFARPIPMTPQADGSFTRDAIYLHPDENYTFCFYADSAPVNGANAAPTDLTSVSYVEGSIAYSGRVNWQTDLNKSLTITCPLTHAVAKVSLLTTTDLEAGSELTLTIPTTYTTYDVQSGSIPADATAITNRQYTYTIPAGGITATDTTLGTEVCSFYTLVRNDIQQLTLANSAANEQDIPNVPLAPNRHTIIVGDVAHTGLTGLGFTATIGESWGMESELVIGGYIYDPNVQAYKVSTADGLLAWSEEVRNNPDLLAIDCILTNDIDFGGQEWTPIGEMNAQYSGIFDGGGHTISRIKIGSVDYNNAGDVYSHAGFFGYLSGSVKDLHIEGTVTCDTLNIIGSHAGSIAAFSFDGIISGCSFSGTMSEEKSAFCGGIVGVAYGGELIACHSSGEISMNTECDTNGGGMYGATVTSVTLRACYSTMEISGKVAGGLAGRGVFTSYACYWSSSADAAIGYENTTPDGATRITDGGTETWATATEKMNAALAATTDYSHYQWTMEGSTTGLPRLTLNN